MGVRRYVSARSGEVSSGLHVEVDHPLDLDLQSTLIIHLTNLQEVHHIMQFCRDLTLVQKDF